jgi:hypothetical protein
MAFKRAPLVDKELTREEIETVLKALGMYQIHLYDEMKLKPESLTTLNEESQHASQAIKKIHGSIESKIKPANIS